MPEGDAVLRTARGLARWLEGREITAARVSRMAVPVDRLVGRRVVRVEARGKHLLVHLSSGDVLHTHMRMSGSWHLYTAGDPWRRPPRQARLVLQAGDRLAVCFNAPVVELLREHGEHAHPALAGLGPDVLRPPVDLAEVRRRARARPPELPVGEALLDQGIVAGIGNIWRCEALFARGVDPWAPLGCFDDDALDALVTAAAELMSANLAPGARPGPKAVYGRAGRPCPRCGAPVSSRRTGAQARTVYWCPRCQRV